METPKRITAGVFALVLGSIGIQHFYTGQILRGVLDILFCFTGIPTLIGIIEGILWLTESEDEWQKRLEAWDVEAGRTPKEK